MAKRRTKRRRWLAILLGIILFVGTVLGVLQMGVFYTGSTWEHWYPNYEKIGIERLLEKENLTQGDYELLYRQTGVTKIGVDDMRTTEQGRAQLLKIQEAMFSDITVKSRRFAPFTYLDEMVGTIAAMCHLKDGDIIVSATTRVSWWRYGHAAIVVDADKHLIAECVGPGTVSNTTWTTVYNDLADFLVLRPKAPEALKEQIAEYILTDMMDVPYRFSTGILTEKFPEKLKYTQCAHFVWYAYKKFGIDLDSNGGGLVKAQDMALSAHVELVQAFGFHLDTLWSE